MKIVIDIPEVFYEALKNTEEIVSGQRSGKTLMSVIYSAVANGTPLEQEPKTDMLDKIRAEIDEQYDRVHPYNISCAEGLEMALGIIDKYMAENE